MRFARTCRHRTTREAPDARLTMGALPSARRVDIAFLVPSLAIIPLWRRGPEAYVPLQGEACDAAPCGRVSLV
jgi:hypothetical protein